MGAREWCELVHLQEVEDTLAVEVGDNADVISEVEAVSKMDALVSIVLVVRCEGGEHSQFDPGGIAVFLDGSNHLNRYSAVLLTVPRFDYFAKRALAKQFDDFV